MNALRMLAVMPGASFSVSDVYNGLTEALERAGHEVIPYALTGRLEFANEYLTALWQRRKEHDPDAPLPLPEDVVYLACSGILERAAWYQPDVILNVSSLFFAPMAVIELRRLGYFVATVLTESPYNDDAQAKIAAVSNVAWTNDRVSVARLREANPHVSYLPASYDPLRHRVDAHIDADVPAHDVVFVGTGWHERVKLLEAVDWTGVDLGLYGVWESVPPGHDLELCIQSGPISNARAVMLYRRAKIGLNLYRTSEEYAPEAAHVTHGESLNPRAYELAACGAFTLSDQRAEVTELFGELVPTFQTPQELEHLIRQYLADDEARAQIAVRLPAVVAGESFDQRAAQIVADIERVRRERRPDWLATMDGTVACTSQLMGLPLLTR